MTGYFSRIGVALLLSLLSSGPRATAQAAAPKGTPPPAEVAARYGAMPLSFEPNRGQTDQSVQWIARGAGYTLFLSGANATLRLESSTAAGPLGRQGEPKTSAVTMRLSGSQPPAGTSPEEPAPGKISYLTGNDPGKWLRNLPTYGRVRVHGVYPGIDLTYYGHRGDLEYDFVVAPEADPAAIQVSFDGALPALSAGGDLLLAAPSAGKLRFGKPVVYQLRDGVREPIAAAYRIASGGSKVSFALGPYDHTRELVIDPKLLFLGALGAGDAATNPSGMTVDPAGNLYIVGRTLSPTFPVTTGAYLSSCGGAFSEQTSGGTANYTRCGNSSGALYSGFITRISADGTTLLSSTYVRGSLGSDYVSNIALDGSGNVWVLGATVSNDFPITSDAIEKFCSPVIPYVTFGAKQGYSIAETSGCNNAYDSYGNQSFQEGQTSLFVSKFDPTVSTLLYSTFFGGSAQQFPAGIALDAGGNVYFSSYVPNQNPPSNLYPNNSSSQLPFPTTTTGFQTTANGDGYATISKLDPTGHTLLYSSLFGEKTAGGYFTTTQPLTMTAGQNGIAFLGGHTTSSTLPTTTGALRGSCITSTGNTLNCLANTGWVAAFDTTKQSTASLLYATYLTGTDQATTNTPITQVLGMTADSSNNLFTTGYTETPDFATSGAYQTGCGGNSTTLCYATAFAAKINPTGTALTWATYLGDVNFGFSGTGYGIVLDMQGRVNLYGDSGDSNFPSVNPITSNAAGQKLFVATLSSDGTKLLFSSRVGNDANTLNPIGGGLALDTAQNLYIVGSVTDNGTLVTTTGTYATTANGGQARTLFAKISPVRSASSTTLTVSPTQTTTGQAVTFSVAVAGTLQTTPAPTGTVTLTDTSVTPNATLGTITLSAGSVSFTTKTLAAGTHLVTATYSGDSVYDVSTGTGAKVTITVPATPTLTLTVPTTAKLQAAVTFTATLTGTAGTPTGTVSFYDGSTLLSTQTVAAGAASYTTSSLAAGSHTITASYSGDYIYAAAVTSAGSVITITSIPTIALTAPTTAAFGSAVALTATVTGTSGTPTGTVTFLDGTTVLNVATLTAGKAAFSTSTLTVGAHTITAQYSGDANFNAVTSTAATVTITALVPTVQLTVAPTTAVAGTTVTLSTSLTGSGATPTGTVSFLDGTTVLNVATIANGSATFSLATLAVGTHSITAVYGGSATYAASTTAAQTVTITSAPAITLTASPSTLTVTRGSSATSVISVVTTGGYAGTVTFSCGALPSSASCAFAPASLTLGSGANTTQTTTLTFSTVTTTHAMLGDGPGHRIPALAFAGLMLPLMLGLRTRLPGKARCSLTLSLLPLSAILLSGTLSGCSSGTASDQQLTPAGTYSVVLNAGGGTATGILNLSVTVQ